MNPHHDPVQIFDGNITNYHGSNGFQRRISTESTDTIDLQIEYDSKPKTRSRSKSKVYGKSSINTISPQQKNNPSTSINNNNNNNNNRNIISDETRKVSNVNPLNLTNIPSREKFIYILIATSLNETFDRKTLTVPKYPNVLKLGRPNSSQKAPNANNGYFDSRVISREHAEIYIKDGKLFIKDCNSSNGTFVNDEKLIQEKELKVEDIVNLGIDIDNEKNKQQHHRKISLKVINILNVPLEEGIDPAVLIQDLTTKADKSHSDTKPNKLSSLDAVLFGDITGDLEDTSLGIDQDLLSGIFVNNSIGTTSSLSHSIQVLINQIHQERLNNLKLTSVENFLQNYKDELSRTDYVSNYTKLKKEIEVFKNKLFISEREISMLKGKLQEKDSIIQTTQSTITLKDQEINKISKTINFQTEKLQDQRNNESVMILNYETEIKLLKAKIDERELLLSKNQEFQNELLKNQFTYQLKFDLYNLALILTFVILIGLFIS
ncbi:hypothetical protein WICMUC_002121 [Wickerhamomyces mucosus]|uniref:FHA domain-containing protein n=1 Tax=Wickerhamomyces mucosus TaxID=1378264 RepID=A0A9P8PS04_9ASCO|nr:hypothetical protein WICMUC_002121 [Wickerhamomyces mucosus]